MTIANAIIQDGQIVLPQRLPFADGTPVQVQIESRNGVGARSQSVGETKDALRFLADNAVDMGVSDWAAQHDHDTLGAPGQP